MTTMNKDQFITNAIVTGEATTLKEAQEQWKAYREETGAGGTVGIAALFYNRLREGIMSDEEFEEWINEQSTNAQKHKSHYNQIRQMANDIHNG